MTLSCEKCVKGVKKLHLNPVLVTQNALFYGEGVGGTGPMSARVPFTAAAPPPHCRYASTLASVSPPRIVERSCSVAVSRNLCLVIADDSDGLYLVEEKNM